MEELKLRYFIYDDKSIGKKRLVSFQENKIIKFIHIDHYVYKKTKETKIFYENGQYYSFLDYLAKDLKYRFFEKFEKQERNIILGEDKNKVIFETEKAKKYFQFLLNFQYVESCLPFYNTKVWVYEQCYYDNCYSLFKKVNLSKYTECYNCEKVLINGNWVTVYDEVYTCINGCDYEEIEISDFEFKSEKMISLENKIDDLEKRFNTFQKQEKNRILIGNEERRHFIANL